MIVASFNVLGLGGGLKRNKIKQLLRQHNVDFLAIQETKMDSISKSSCASIWGNEDFDWAFLPSEGNSGGILSIWRKSMATLYYTFRGEGFVGVCFDWGIDKQICIIINVYSKCDLADKKRLWARLILARRNLGCGAWCIMGDFNVVGEREERRGVNEEVTGSHVVEMALYKAFRREIDLEDKKVVGRRFTWYHSNGISMSRIDRVLISEEWNRAWGDSTLWVLPRDVSDHCPLVLKVGGWDWGPKPFRFNNYWLENRRFKPLVEEVWRNQNLGGWMRFILKEKLKNLKIRLKAWNKEEYGGMEDRVHMLVEEIAELDGRGEVGLLSELEVQLRKDKFGNLLRLLRAKDSLMVQRSRSRWLKEGDANTKFFHNCVKGRVSRNHVSVLLVDGGWVQSPSEIRREVVNYFTNHVSSKRCERLKLDGVHFVSVSDMENAGLIVPFLGDEIDRVIKESDGTKSPGLDGFNFAFFKEFWYLLKDEVRILFDQFHANEVLPKGLLSYFVALIPKVASPMDLKDFRPISLLGSLYKIVLKVLAKRLAGVMNSIISTS